MKNLFALLPLHAIPLVIAQMKSYSILHFDFYLCSVYWKKKKLLFLYFCLRPLAALYNTCNSANRSKNTTKNREVFQKTHCTEGAWTCKGLVKNGLAKGIRSSDTIFYRCRSEGAMRFPSESQAAYERGRNQNYTLFLERKYSAGCKHWSTAVRYLTGNHTFLV